MATSNDNLSTKIGMGPKSMSPVHSHLKEPARKVQRVHFSGSKFPLTSARHIKNV